MNAQGMQEVVGGEACGKQWRVNWGGEVCPCPHSAVAANLGGCAEHQLFSRDPKHQFPAFSRACWDFHPLCFKK